jgi:FkbM family methyltransferase
MGPQHDARRAAKAPRGAGACHAGTASLNASFRRKFNTFKHLLESRDIGRICQLLLRRVFHFLYGFVVGKCIELTGDAVTLDGCRFSLAGAGILTSHKSTFLFGAYEKPERDAVTRFLCLDHPVVELGAGLGVVSCISNKRLTNPHAHVVVEANPLMIPLIEKNKAINRCHFRVMNAAVSYLARSRTEIHLDQRFDRTSILLSNETNSVSVETTTLRDILDKEAFPTFTLICDVEGCEIDIIEYEIDLLKDRAVMTILELHPHLTGSEQAAAALGLLLQAGFKIIHSDVSVYTCINTAIYPEYAPSQEPRHKAHSSW